MPGLLQHVIIRGVNGCEIFRDNADRERFLRRFSTLLVQTGTDCLAWSLLTNHCHLLLRPRDSCLAPLMRKLLTGYAVYFNLRHKRSGHLFQNRYKSIVCEEDSYQLELVRYIHLNPLRAGLVENLAALDTYAWSGHAVIMGNGALEGQAISQVLSLFSRGKPEARKRYRQFVADGVRLGRREELGSQRRMTRSQLKEQGDGPYDHRVLGSSEFVEELRRRDEFESKLAPLSAIQDIVASVCRHFGIDAEALQLKSRAATIVDARSIICFLAVRQAGHSGVEVGSYVNLRRAGVSVAANRGERLVAADQSLLGLIDK
ncbi:MAG: helix-turn-helix domain-containing protein [Syntrophotaleaceae bacterium]